MAKFTDYLKNIFFILILLQIAPPIIKGIVKNYTQILEPQTKVAYLPIKGVLYDSTHYVRYLRKYFKDDDIKAILIKMESPGSAAATGEIIAHELETLKKEYPKPIITLCENLCTSGAYYIASSTDFIIAAPSTFIGSIGATIPYQFRFNKLLEQVHVGYNVIKSGEFKNATDPFVATTPEQMAMLQGLSNDSYQNFVAHVAQQRHQVSKENASEWAEGKLFTGRQALKIGLIDQIGSHSNAVVKIKELAVVVGDIEWVKPEKTTGLMALLGGGQDESTEFHDGVVSSIMNSACNYVEERYIAPRG